MGFELTPGGGNGGENTTYKVDVLNELTEAGEKKITDLLGTGQIEILKQEAKEINEDIYNIKDETFYLYSEIITNSNGEHLITINHVGKKDGTAILD